MESGIYKLIDASLVQQHRFDNISHNLANSSTNAFKKNVFTFDQALSTVSRSALDFTPGPIIHTGNELDVAIEEEGFFKVQTTKGTRYTRDGALSLNREHVLVTASGDPVLGNNGSITLDGSNIFIDVSGQVYVDNQPIDKIAIVGFEDVQLLRKEGQSYYHYEGDDKGVVAVEDPKVRQRYLEKSNVTATEEMIKMIEAFRTFESVQKAIQSIDEITSKMVNDPGLIQ